MNVIWIHLDCLYLYLQCFSLMCCVMEFAELLYIWLCCVNLQSFFVFVSCLLNALHVLSNQEDVCFLNVCFLSCNALSSLALGHHVKLTSWSHRRWHLGIGDTWQLANKKIWLFHMVNKSWPVIHWNQSMSSPEVKWGVANCGLWRTLFSEKQVWN